jgi:DNA-binding MarR family transcriptional regulator
MPPRNSLEILLSEVKDGSEYSGPDQSDLGDLTSLSSSGPLNSSARVAILAALLALRRTTFTELMLAVSLPKSSLNLSLAILEQNKFVTVRKGFVQIGGPRTIVEITSQGEKAIRDHLLMMQELARKLLPK